MLDGGISFCLVLQSAEMPGQAGNHARQIGFRQEFEEPGQSIPEFFGLVEGDQQLYLGSSRLNRLGKGAAPLAHCEGIGPREWCGVAVVTSEALSGPAAIVTQAR